MNKYLLYRICTKVNDKPRVAGFSKLACLDNLLSVFPDYKMVCFADHCDSETVSYLERKNFHHFEATTLGQVNSFYHLVRFALNNFHDEDIVYVIEDDYWHTPKANEVLDEGLKVFNYVTLYDHPDKYGGFEFGTNPYVCHDTLSEPTRVYKGNQALWRTTNSTTHSFACSVRILREDSYIWLGKLKRRPILQDFYDWIFLTKPGFNGGRLRKKYLLRQLIAYLAIAFGSKRRTLGVPIPSASAHLEMKYLPNQFDVEIFKS
jgi:hypothetical protein